jgi:hypothetical protein
MPAGFDVLIIRVPYMEQNFDARVPLGQDGFVMTTFQAIVFGAMLAWTPSLVVLAWLIREAPLDESDEF